MSAATLSALALAIALPAAAQPAADAKPTLPSKPAVLAEIFQAHLAPGQAAKLKQQTPEEMVRLFIPPQKEAARRSLIERAATTKDPEQLAELGRGHLLLGDPQGLVGAGAQMAQLYPGESRGFTMMGQGLAKQGKDSEALAVVNRALELNPNDDGAKGLRVLIESRRRFGGRGAATPVASAPARTIEAAMVALPNAAAYKAAVAMGGATGATVVDSARRALSDLRPAASRHVPLNVTTAEDPTPKTPWNGAKAAGLAAAATMGSLLLFLGLFPKRLDQEYPWLKTSMAGGVLLAGAVISYDLAASHFIYGRYVAWRLSSPTTAAMPAAAAAAAPEAAAPAASAPASTLPTISMTPHPSLAASGAGLASQATQARNVANQVPTMLARVMPWSDPSKNPGFIGREGARRAFVTAADDIAGLKTPTEIAERLGIEKAQRYIIIRFPATEINKGLATPTNYSDPLFLGRGLTSGGAREFIVPNLRVPPTATFEIIQ